MSDEQSPGTPVPASPLERYRAGLRRERGVYAGVLAAVVVVLVVLTVVAWSRGETNNSTLRTVAVAPANLPLAAPAAAPSQVWTSSARAAIGDPQYLGTVVLFDRHTVRGVEASSGKTTWSYTRSDRTVCTAAQLAGVTITVYALRGNCDQVTALDSGTGERRWTRTLDMDGMPVNGRPVFGTSSQGTYTTFVVRTRDVVYALDPSNGYNRWTYTRYGCAITGAVVGSSGGLISQNCSSKVVCGKLKFCGTGPQLFLLPNSFNREDDQKDVNPDHIIWNRRGVRAVPVSADRLVSAISGGALVHFDASDGTTTARTALFGSGRSPVSATETTVSGDTGSVEIVGVGSAIFAIEAGTAKPRWNLLGLAPTVVATDGDVPALGSARITAVGPDSAATVDGATGRVSVRSALPRVPTGSTAYPLGSGFLVAGPDGTTAYA